MKRRYPYVGRGTFGASWIESFKFTHEQREILVTSLSNKRNIIATKQENNKESLTKAKKAHEYIDKVELEIPRWKGVAEKIHREATPPTEFKENVEAYHSAILRLQETYSALESDVYSGINAFTDEVLLIEPSPKTKRLGDALADAVASDLPAGAVGLSEADDFIKDLLELMRDGAQRTIENIDLPTGTRNQHVKNLVNALVEIYIHTYQKLPSANRGGIFRRFTTALAPMLYIEIGENTLQRVIARYK